MEDGRGAASRAHLVAVAGMPNRHDPVRPRLKAVCVARRAGVRPRQPRILAVRKPYWLIICLIPSLVAPEARHRHPFAVNRWTATVDPILARALSVRDASTAEHCDRVADLAVRLGCAVDLAEHDLAVLALSAHLHDIGKLHLPDAILRKAGPLDAREWAVMQSHSVRGETIIRANRDLPFRDEIAVVVRHHHEHWNGGGYPDGLRSEAIPLLSRILSVVDSYDAMTSLRPYHRVRTSAAALAQLDTERGAKHDPSIFDAFMASGIR